jgi:hypothetical protein
VVPGDGGIGDVVKAQQFEPGRSERRLECGRRREEARFGRRGPRRRVLRLLVAGEDLVEDVVAAGNEHAVALGEQGCLVRDVHRAVLRPHEVEAVLGKRHRQRIADLEAHAVLETGALR